MVKGGGVVIVVVAAGDGCGPDDMAGKWVTWRMVCQWWLWPSVVIIVIIVVCSPKCINISKKYGAAIVAIGFYGVECGGGQGGVGGVVIGVEERVVAEAVPKFIDKYQVTIT